MIRQNNIEFTEKFQFKCTDHQASHRVSINRQEHPITEGPDQKVHIWGVASIPPLTFSIYNDGEEEQKCNGTIQYTIRNLY